MRRPPKCSCRCVECPETCTLRVFDTSSGELLWQKNGFKVIGASHSGNIFGVRYRKLTTSFKRVQLGQVRVTPNPITAAMFTGSNDWRFQLKDLYGSLAETNTGYPLWAADIVRIDTDGTETTLATNAYHAEGTSCDVQTPAWGMGNELLFTSIPFAGLQHWRCNDSNLIIGLPGCSPNAEVFDLNRLTKTHRMQWNHAILSPVSTTRIASWVLEINGSLIRVPLYGTASEWQTALAAAPGVVNVTVTGGPSCLARMTVDIEFSSTSGQIKNAGIENARGSINQNGLGVFDLSSLSPVAVYSPTTEFPGVLLDGVSFTSSGNALLANGNWGGSSLGVLGARNRSWSRIEWTMPGGTPNWGTFHKVWSVDAFAGMQQIQSTAGTTTILRALSGVRNGKLAIASTACRLTNTLAGPFYTHLILNESDGSVVESGWNGLMVFSQCRFDDGSQWYFTGTRARLGSTNFHEVAMVESYGTTSGGGDLRERDWPSAFNSTGVAGMLISLGGSSVGASTQRIRDSFDSVAYNRNDGTIAWSGSWTESPDTTDPASGDIRIVSDGTRSVLRLGNDTASSQANSIRRSVNLSSFTAAVLVLSYRRAGMVDSNNYVTIEVSANGTTFTEIGRISGPTNDTEYQVFSADIAAFASSTTTIRLTVPETMDAGAAVFIDYVEITVAVPSGIMASQATASSTTGSIQASWLGRTETKTAQGEYPWGSFRRDVWIPISYEQRFSRYHEWRLLHGLDSSGTFFTNKSTPWYSDAVSLSTVQSDLTAWYGSVVGGGSIVRINPFGDDPRLMSQNPELPTWQKINELVILRHTGANIPASPLVPSQFNTLRLEVRNLQQIVSKSMIGLAPATGVIQWQRDVGTKNGVATLWNLVRVSDGQVVAATECSPTIVPDVFPRGAL